MMEVAVFQRDGEPCKRCGTAVRRIVQSGRSTFYCPRCQR
jgi:formamidopyrimidine-DNA glycosylase